MCDCIKEVTKKTMEALEKRNKDKGIVSDGQMKETSFVFRSDGKATTMETGQSFGYKFTPLKKNGSMGLQINKTGSLHHYFCPFCGEKYPE